MPILQAPDEQAHLDYALNIYSAHRLITAREPFHEWNVGSDGSVNLEPGATNHVFTSYLVQVSGFLAIHGNADAKVSRDYGTGAYYRRVDENAPAEASGNMKGKPRNSFGFLALYPYGYYSLVAAWMGLLSAFSHRLTVLFFGARLFSVGLLLVTLMLVYGTSRELRFRPRRALLHTALVGFFPLTSFVSSAVQADNLSLMLVMLSLYLSLRVRRTFGDWRATLLLGLALGMLCVTKYHYYLCVFIAIGGMLISGQLRTRRRGITWPRLLGLTLGPTIALALVQVWVIWGAGVHGLPAIPSQKPYDPFLASTHSAVSFANFVISTIGEAFANFYLNGSTFASFWGHFGWMDTPLTIGSPGINDMVRYLIALLNVVTFGLVLVRLERVATRLVSIARHRGWRKALAIASSNPVLNAYFIFTVMMFALYVLSQMNLAGQGRYWLPFIFPIFLTGTQYAPRALSHHITRSVFSNLITAGLILYCILGSYYSIQSLIVRYYWPVMH
ncbi:MAG TPA: glycosyltransferase family 39 protein [Blastocatellia bacterium]|nr:glycosyltransferase family 39 protein [Blastocatellia bacterium]